MARADVAAALALCLLALAAAAPDFSQSDEVYRDTQEGQVWSDELAEEERAGQEAQPQAVDGEQWQGDDALEEQGDAALQEEYQQRGNAEQQTQQVQSTQVVQDRDEGTLDRLRQADQQRGQLQQDQDQQRGQIQQDQDQQRGQIQQDQDQQRGQIQQDQQWSQQTRDQQRGQIQQGSGGNDKPQDPVPSNSGSGIVADSASSKPAQNPAQYPAQNPQNPAQNPASNPLPQPAWRPPTGSVRPSQPPSGYTRLSYYGHFKAFTTPLTWPEALVTCLADGALLAVPGSEAEAGAVGEFYGKVKNLAKKSTDKELFFIGASDLHKEGSFVTVFGTKFEPSGQWYRWQKGEPNNMKKLEHCVLSNEKGFYWDGNCQSKYAFVCQFKDLCQNSPRSDQLQQSQDLQQQTQQRY